ncbi:MAG TPA: family 1 glycosylhydrolase [Chitinophagaceae bacterium]|nr:family 1 glycosylhydrolase [Chitinophagaceae bacterium]
MEKNTFYCKPEIWGGVECTINRVKDEFRDQLEYTGYYTRGTDDIDLFAGLGIKAFRFPILWERHQPARDTQIDFSWAEKQLQRLQHHNITPIAGLVHHGSGPAFTSLTDDAFPNLLAEYAAKVAQQFPFIEYYTPINEPLTTARFSGLYALWYPHQKTDRSFVKMVLNQAKGIVLSMQAIRKINPAAKLVLTEDLGKIYSTKPLQYQAKFENKRRWLVFDLLCGRFMEKHSLWKYFIKYTDAATLKFFTDNACPPNIIGANHYITSERFLDHDYKKYPKAAIGGNRRHRYADVEAVRVNHGQPSGLKVLLKELWERYSIPIAITEVQLHCHREEQMRWLRHVWKTAVEAQQEGVDIRAVTVWALLGASGWNKLLTCEGEYESGVFDIRGGRPRMTAIGTLIRSLSNGVEEKFPFLKEPGWWQRNMRFIKSSERERLNGHFGATTTSRPLLIIGKTGTLGKAFARLCELRGLSYRLLSRQDVDIADEAQIQRVIDLYKPWAIVNAAGFVRVDDAEMEKDVCFLANVQGPENLARVCRRHGIRFMTFSSDLVFDGKKNNPYIESDAVFPLNVYGASKARSEIAVMQHCPDALIIRTSAFFGPWDQYNFASHVLSALEHGRPFTAAHDVRISPTYVPDLVHYALDLLIDEEKQIWHISNTGDTSWYELAREVAGRAKLNKKLIQPTSMETMELRAPRPAYSVIKSEKGLQLPGLENALERFFIERKTVNQFYEQ